ncbi:MAG: hypothetical protein J0L64_01070 [Acidobacteria bacterium]|nr:hypothetical protein [Acidobacteriota bacterium]
MRTTLIAVLVTSAALAQPLPQILAGAGYRNTPPSIDAAPGQVMIVSLYGAAARLNAPAAGDPGPDALFGRPLAGLTARLVETGQRVPLRQPVTIRILGASQTHCLGGAPSCAPVTNLTLQIPFELAELAPATTYAAIEVYDDGRLLGHIPVRAVTDRPHIITSCDDSLVYYSVFGGETLSACTAAVVKPRGGLIRPGLPVSPGEPLVAFAYGMGLTKPAPGAPIDFKPGLTIQPFTLRFSVAGGPAFWAQAPDGVSLTTAYGVYQVHFTMPPLPASPALPPCGEGGLYGNVKVSIAGLHASDEFELCVAP